MRNLMSYKTFEARQLESEPILATSEEDLTNYYRCNKCKKVFLLFNEQAENCTSCRSNDISHISDFDYFAELKKGDQQLYKTELTKKNKRGKGLVDLINVGVANQEKYKRRSIN